MKSTLTLVIARVTVNYTKVLREAVALMAVVTGSMMIGSTVHVSLLPLTLTQIKELGGIAPFKN
jgi:hypothetical protein